MMIEKIYHHFNLSYPKHLNEKISTYLQKRPKDKFGKHQYTLGEFGLSEDMVNDDFKDYLAFMKSSMGID